MRLVAADLDASAARAANAVPSARTESAAADRAVVDPAAASDSRRSSRQRTEHRPLRFGARAERADGRFSAAAL